VGGTLRILPRVRALGSLWGVRLAAVPFGTTAATGLLIADNLITGKPIFEEDLVSLETFANYATMRSRIPYSMKKAAASRK
jgi:hypothetical protein